jgi:chemotaxis protein MotB
MSEQPIIIKRYKKTHHRTHGGAWKIAYADFVTAMMAFFLLMWLINVATDETKKGIAEYFTSSIINMESASTGTGMMDGETSAPQNGNSEQEIENDNNNKSNTYNSNVQKLKEKAAPKIQLYPDDFAPSQMGDKDNTRKITTYTNESNKPNIEHHIKRQGAIPEDKDVADLKKMDDKDHGKGSVETKNMKEDDKKSQEKQVENAEIKNSKLTKKELEEQLAAIEKAEKSTDSEKVLAEELRQKEIIQKIENNIKAAFNSPQEMKKFKHNLIVELADEGIRIQIVDSPAHEMFKSGSPIPVKFTEGIIKALGKILVNLPNKINITGHADSKPYNKKGYGNWELSSDRAHATRRILEDSNIKSNRFIEVNGRSDRDPFNKKDPTAAENRRISITILFDKLQKQQQEDPKNDSVDTKKAEAKSSQKP